MSASLELVQAPTLEELAATANSEYELAREAGKSMLEHAILAGEALLLAKPLIPFGEWDKWNARNIKFPTRAHRYMWLAENKEEVLSSGVPHMTAALQMLGPRGSAAIEMPGGALREQEADRVREMRAEGATYSSIAKQLDVSVHKVYNIANPAKYAENKERSNKWSRERYARQKREREAVEAFQRERSIKKALVKEGQAFNEVYAMLTRMDDLLGQARGETEDREKRRAIAEMHGLRNKMRDMAHAMLGVS